MGDYSSIKAEIVYRHRGLNVSTVLHVPHGRDGKEAVAVLVSVIDELEAAQTRAEEQVRASLAAVAPWPFGRRAAGAPASVQIRADARRMDADLAAAGERLDRHFRAMRGASS